MKAFIFDPLWDELITSELEKQLREASIETVITKEAAPIADCKALFEGDEERILCVNPDYVSWKLTVDDYQDIPNLKGIFGAATSTSWIDKTVATERDIPVCDIVNFSTEAVAEWAILMLLNVARQTPRIIKDGFPLNPDTDFMKYRGIELKGKKLGIVGLGHISSAIAERCAGLGMEVTYWSRSPKENSYTYVDLPQLVAESDVVIPGLEYNPETKDILNNELLGTMKPSAIFVTFEDKLIDEEFLIDMVKEGKLYGFGFEGKAGAFPQYEGNVWAAPSYGWATDTTMHNSMVKWIDNMVQAARGEFPYRVN